jgi:hypothetical protein
MKLIAHQAKGLDLPIGLGTRLAHSLEEALPIRVIAEDGFAPVPVIHDVVNRACVFNAQRS